MFSIRVAGQVYDGFISNSFNDAAENLCNKFDANCAVDGGRAAFPVKRGDDIDILIEGSVVSKASIETLKVNAPVDGFFVAITGRDKTKSILKSDLSASFAVKGPVSLKRIMELCLDDIGVNFEIVDEVGDLEDFTEKEIAVVDVGGDVWGLWQQLSEKKKVIISKNRQGKLVIRRSGTRKYNRKLIRKYSDPSGENNITASSGSSSDASRRKTHNVAGQENVSVKRDDAPPTGNKLFEAELPSDETKEDNPSSERLTLLNSALRDAKPGSERERAIDAQIASEFSNNVAEQNKKNRNSKRFKTTRTQTLGVAEDALATDGVSWTTADSPADDDDCEAIANRKLNDSRIASVSYSCEVFDFIADDEPWESGWLVDVIDEYCDVSATMMIRKVSFSTAIDEDGEPVRKCSIDMTIPDAYGDTGSASALEKQVTVIGEKFNQGNIVS